MLTSSIKKIITCLLLTFLVAGCATKSQRTMLKSHPVSKYEQEKKAGIVGANTAEHVPPVPHKRSVEPMAKKVIGEYFQGLKLMKEGKYYKATIIMQSISSRYPMLSGPIVNQGVMLVSQKKYEEAQEKILKALDTNPKNPYAHNLLGITHREQGNFKKAKAAYMQATLLDENYAKAHFNLAVLAELYLQDLPLALAHFEKYQFLQRKPDKTVKNWIKDLRRRTGIKESTLSAQTKLAQSEAVVTSNDTEDKNKSETQKAITKEVDQ